MYRKRDTGEVFKLHSEIRAAYPNPTLPAIITDEVLQDAGYDVIRIDAQAYDVEVEKLVESTLELESGMWVQRYNIVPLSVEEIKAKVPMVVTRRQARQALLLAGLLEQVPVLIDMLPDPIQKGMAKIEWEDSLEFERNRPLLIQIGLALGLDEAGLDALFIKASKL